MDKVHDNFNVVLYNSYIGWINNDQLVISNALLLVIVDIWRMWFASD